MDCAIIGFGESGKIYYKHILDNPKLNLKYIYDIRVEEIKLFSFQNWRKQEELMIQGRLAHP